MKKEPAVDYLKAVAHLSQEVSPSWDERVVLPELAGEQVVDYLAVLE